MLKDSSCILLGHFNLPHTNWVDGHFPMEYKSQVILNFSNELGLTQLMLKPTRKQNVLDLLFVNEPLLIADLICDVPFCTSDHDSITFNIFAVRVDAVPTCDALPIRLWKRANWDLLGDFFYSYDWDALLCRGDVSNANVCLNNCSCVITERISLYVPMTKLRTTTKNNKHHDRNIQKLICKKRKY